uniref:Putative secreted protein n=1 Tax=Ixodes ricinus TaxID=34613 RepID=A0A6B0UX58_IXORI
MTGGMVSLLLLPFGQGNPESYESANSKGSTSHYRHSLHALHLHSALDGAFKVLRLSVGWLHPQECLDELQGLGVLLQLCGSHCKVKQVVPSCLCVTVMKQIFHEHDAPTDVGRVPAPHKAPGILELCLGCHLPLLHLFVVLLLVTLERYSSGMLCSLHFNAYT